MRYLFILIMIILPANVFGQQEVKPEGGLLVFSVIFLLALILGLLYFAFRRNEKTVHPVRLQIKLKLFHDDYSGRGNKYFYRKLEVKISNRGKSPVEFSSPLIQFERLNKKRKFKPKMQEEQRLYPLSLYPGTDHTFKIDIGKFYQIDAALQNYKRIRLLIPGIEGEIIKQQVLKF